MGAAGTVISIKCDTTLRWLQKEQTSATPGDGELG